MFKGSNIVKQIKMLILGTLIGVVLGLWFGVNIGKDRAIFSNPFAEDSIQEKLKKSGSKLLEKGGEALEKSGKALQDKIKEPVEP